MKLWHFNKKAVEPDWRTEQVAELRAFRDVGQTFNYLGRTCIVTRHWEWAPILGGYLPRLVCDYADEHGVIHNVTFAPYELPGLIAQNSGE